VKDHRGVVVEVDVSMRAKIPKARGRKKLKNG
jgi:hypothetical protein